MAMLKFYYSPMSTIIQIILVSFYNSLGISKIEVWPTARCAYLMMQRSDQNE